MSLNALLKRMRAAAVALVESDANAVLAQARNAVETLIRDGAATQQINVERLTINAYL